MKTPLIVRFAALSASALITLALVQSIALIGHPHRPRDRQLAQTDSTVASTRLSLAPGSTAPPRRVGPALGGRETPTCSPT